jgi:hypothetical protein
MDFTAVEQDDVSAGELAFDDPDQFVAVQIRELTVQHYNAGATTLKRAESFGSGADVLH